MKTNKPHMLMILDGWGIGSGKDEDAVTRARTPFLDKLLSEYPVTRLTCSGPAVGLPEGVMGNSEVGHLNIGAGRVVYQDLLRIDSAIENNEFFQNGPLNAVMDRGCKSGKALHLMGLVSDGGVHSQLTHMLALVDMARKKGVPQLYIHAILDGRDTSPTAGADYIRTVQTKLKQENYGYIASLCGRYYAMDRDKRWERVEKAHRLYTLGEGLSEPDPVAAVEKAYERGETDEFIKPVIIEETPGERPGIIRDGDGFIFFNFRADRAREITSALTDDGFSFFPREARPKISEYVTMTLYDETFALPIAFPPVHLDGILGEAVGRKGLRQLRIAETEKYAHVTYFFNGGEEKPFPGEDRCLIPSPRDVATYDEKPEMSAPEVTEEVLKRLRSREYDLIILNFANMDMVGHTGIPEAAVKACETVDGCADRIVTEILSQNGTVIITADHGNAEKMFNEDGSPHTAHTVNPVRLVLADDSRKHVRLKEGKLGDIAPTILDIMDLEKPSQMTGISLIGADEKTRRR